jgi:prevent-host-death family protein
MATALTALQARVTLHRLIDEVAESHQPILITGKRNSAVLLSEEDWRAIQETLYLLSVPEVRESIRKRLAEPVKNLSRKPGR